MNTYTNHVTTFDFPIPKRSKRRCKCGSSDHLRVTAASCLLNPTNIKRRSCNINDDNGEDNDRDGDIKIDKRGRCKCGSSDHARVTAASCPLNRTNIKRRRGNNTYSDARGSGDDNDDDDSDDNDDDDNDDNNGDNDYDDHNGHDGDIKLRKHGKCKCGTSDHARVTATSCPLNPTNIKRRLDDNAGANARGCSDDDDDDDGGINNDDFGDPEKHHEYDQIRGSCRDRRKNCANM